MNVIVAGGHGKIAQHLLETLAGRGYRAAGLVRNPDHVADLEALGAEAIVCDLEDDGADVEAAVAGFDALVFAAGAGPGSGPERKRTVDLGGVVRTVAACEAAGVGRYVVVSAMGAGDPSASEDEGFRAYLQAKHDADEAALASGLAVTIVRPGGLTDDAATGSIAVGVPSLGRRGQIPRADVASVLVAVLDAPATAGATFEVVGGDEAIGEAISALTVA